MINLKDARQIIAAAEAKAHEFGQPVNIAVVDAGGNLVSHVRIDGARIGSIDVSINKAFTARAFDISTAQLSENSQPGQQLKLDDSLSQRLASVMVLRPQRGKGSRRLPQEGVLGDPTWASTPKIRWRTAAPDNP